MKIITVTWFYEYWAENCIAPISSCLGVSWIQSSHQSRGFSNWRKTWFWELHCVWLPELWLVAKRRQGLANFSFAFITGYYKCHKRVFMSLTTLCISTVFRLIEIMKFFSSVLGIPVQDCVSLFCPFTAPATLSILFLLCVGSPVIVEPLCQETLRDTVPLGCWWTCPMVATRKSQFGFGFSSFPVTNPLCTTDNFPPEFLWSS